MPAKLDRCVEKLISEGYSEDEAWTICKKRLNYDENMAREKKKRLFTGQLIDEEYLQNKKIEFKQEEEQNGED